MIKIYSDGAATMKCINGEYQRENGGAAMAVIQDEKVIYEETKHFENTIKYLDFYFWLCYYINNRKEKYYERNNWNEYKFFLY